MFEIVYLQTVFYTQDAGMFIGQLHLKLYMLGYVALKGYH
jgi:hypothetical protein